MADEKDTTKEESEEAQDVSAQSAQEEIKEEEKAEEPKEEAKKEESKAEAPVAQEKPAKVEKPEPSGKFKDVIKQIEELSVKDLAELVKELEERFGVSAAAPVAVAGGGAATGGADAGAEEKSEYSVFLAEAGAQKIAVIKAVREIRPDLGLKEAKDLVDGAPKEIKAQVPTEEAKVAKEKLEAAGAKVELK